MSRNNGSPNSKRTKNYAEFLHRKSQLGTDCGFDPIWMPDFLYDFQKHLVEWACRKGRCAIFADCGMGKTPMQLVWAENVRRKTNKPVLILTPLAVSQQTVSEGEKFGIKCERRIDGQRIGKDIYIANYERLHYFNPQDFGGMVCDESSILKNFNGQTKKAVTEFMRMLPYRLLCTATAAPNDCHELGTSSEALGELGYQDMLSRFFKEDVIKDYLGWGRKTFRFRGHAEEPFWRWVSSWSRSLRKPSDLGFDDALFSLPPLIESEVIVSSNTLREGMLFSTPARSLQEQRQERRATLDQRCDAAAQIAVGHDGPTVIWCHLNDEADRLESIIDGALQVSGSMSEREKESRLLAFQRGELKTLVTKPKIGAWGLNWQHCDNVVTFASHSWEQYYQSVRRCWRFGQKRPVKVSLVCSEGEIGVLANLKRKAAAADHMFASLCKLTGDAVRLSSTRIFDHDERMPTWLAKTKC